MRRLLPLVAVLALVACTVDTTGVSSRSLRAPRGNPDATILVEEFADLQCPACKSATEQIAKPLLAKYGSQIRFEFKHFPLRQIHPYALEAAEAAECAADQDKFWQFHDLAYEQQSSLSSKAIRDWAKKLSLDSDTFERCMKSKLKRKIVLADFEEGRDRGVNGTPTYFVNGEKVATTMEDLSAAIDRALGSNNLPL